MFESKKTYYQCDPKTNLLVPLPTTLPTTLPTPLPTVFHEDLYLLHEGLYLLHKARYQRQGDPLPKYEAPYSTLLQTLFAYE